jgi:hypothetical protein
MRRFQPALLGGLFIGVLSSLPLVNIANACCCLWVIAGGMLTVYLQRQSPPPPGTTDTVEAVLGGLIAGAVGGLIYGVFNALIFTTGMTTAAEIEQALGRFPQIPSDLRDRAIQLSTSGSFFLLSTVFMIAIYAVAGLVGALLGLAIWRKPAAVPPSPPELPASPQG